LNGERIALRNAGGVQYLFSDHLGSTSIIADSTGTLLVEQRYTAYGESRYTAGTLATGYQYTGQRSQMGEVGLYYYNARWYDPALGRFAQADTLVPQPGNAQDWDRYGYVRNNPVAYRDPSGHKQECGQDGDTHCGAGAGPVQATLVIQASERALDNVWAVSQVVLGVINEPTDYIITGSQCIQGDCSPWMLLGLLPGIPSSLSQKTGDAISLVVPARRLFFSQKGISSVTRDKSLFLDEFANLLAQSWSGAPLQVLTVEGKWVSINNRRLAVAKLLDVDVPVHNIGIVHFHELITKYHRDGIFSQVQIRGTGITIDMFGRYLEK
jgi:RHS repeat-associated protein